VTALGRGFQFAAWESSRWKTDHVASVSGRDPSRPSTKGRFEGTADSRFEERCTSGLGDSRHSASVGVRQQSVLSSHILDHIERLVMADCGSANVAEFDITQSRDPQTYPIRLDTLPCPCPFGIQSRCARAPVSVDELPATRATVPRQRGRCTSKVAGEGRAPFFLSRTSRFAWASHGLSTVGPDRGRTKVLW
jgi:hypothetical protein